MKLLIHVQLHEERNLGDHGEMLASVVNCPPGTTIETLAEYLVDAPRFKGDKSTVRKNDYLVVRVGEVPE
jgi:hypothetical protein